MTLDSLKELVYKWTWSDARIFVYVLSHTQIVCIYVCNLEGLKLGPVMKTVNFLRDSPISSPLKK